jgi:hypothetical protein
MGNADADERRSLIMNFMSVKVVAFVPTLLVFFLGMHQDANAYTIGAVEYEDCDGEADVKTPTALDLNSQPESPPDPDGSAFSATMMLAILPRKLFLPPPMLKLISNRGGHQSKKSRRHGSNGRVSSTRRPTSWMYDFKH